jgi:hypothetical protein
MPKSWGEDPDDWIWERDANQLLHTGLDQVRKAAEKWAATISVLLGLFSTVAFIKGPDTFSDLEADWAAALAASLIVLAVLLAGAAILLAALAAQGTPRWAKKLDGWTLKTYYREQARKARTELAWSRVLAVTAALSIVAGVSVTWFETLGTRGTKPTPSAQSAIITSGAVVRCGALTVAPNGDVLFATTGRTPVPLSNLHVSNVIPVASCPPTG